MLTCVLSLRVSTTPFQTLDTAIGLRRKIIAVSNKLQITYLLLQIEDVS